VLPASRGLIRVRFAYTISVISSNLLGHFASEIATGAAEIRAEVAQGVPDGPRPDALELRTVAVGAAGLHPLNRHAEHARRLAGADDHVVGALDVRGDHCRQLVVMMSLGDSESARPRPCR
jgi:hypothetical protein